MIEPQEDRIDQIEAETIDDVEEFERGERRYGSAFDTLLQVGRGTKELRFTNDFTIKNRPKLGDSPVRIKNMWEGYYNKPADDGINAIVLGRKGDGNFRNNHLIELAAKHSSPMSNDQGINNGAIKLRVTRDDEDPDFDNVGILVADTGTINKGHDGVTIRLVPLGANGGLLIGHTEDREVLPSIASGIPIMIVDRDGIQYFNLPTSEPAFGDVMWNDDGILKLSGYPGTISGLPENVTQPSRSFDTVYKNETGGGIIVNVVAGAFASSSGSAELTARIREDSGSSWITVATGGIPFTDGAIEIYANINFVVPTGWEYQVFSDTSGGSTILDNWVEYTN